MRESVPAKKKRLLAVEDEMTQQLVIDTLLKSFRGVDWEIEWAENAAEAFEYLKAKPYDLIITDIFLDGKITGIDLWRFCKKVCPEIPVLIISSLPFDKFREFDAADSSKLHYLQKPLNPRALENRVMSLLGY